MSVFRGSITEYPGVIIDHFITVNCENGRAFFLSHCHRDHMTGLSSPAIHHALQGRCTYLYCSVVTKSLLLKDPEFSSLAPYLKSLPMEQPVAMVIDTVAGHTDTSLSFTVTLLPAGHCPGSVMFFFQGPNGNVLYTGDFRLTLTETQRLHALHSNGSLVDIATLYLDTTFCHPSASKIPSRSESRDQILKIMDRWLTSDESNVVSLHCAAFGYEHIFMSIAEKFKSKIHIAKWKIQAYADLPAVANILTADGNSTRIHVCNFRRGASKTGCLPCGSCPVKGKPHILHIKPSTLWFLSTTCSLSEPSVYLPHYNSYRVLHSMHASFTELCEFVSYLKPRKVVPCVVPMGDKSLKDVCDRLKVLFPRAQVVSDVITEIMRNDKGKEMLRFEEKDSLTNCENGYENFSIDGSEYNLPKLAPFSSSDSMADRLLPSMISPLTPTNKVIAAPSSQSSENEDYATTGSLEQTSLDLSLDSTSDTNTDANTDLNTNTRANTDLNANTANIDVNVTAEANADYHLPSTPDYLATHSHKNPMLKKLSCDGGGSPDPGDWHLTQESSSSEDTPTSCHPAAQCPASKRPKVTNDLDGHNFTPFNHRVCDHEGGKDAMLAPILYIDLTQDDTLDKNDKTKDHQYALINDHHQLVEPILVESSNSEEDNIIDVCSLNSSENSSREESSSPNILPPTPGREKVNSILNRKDLTLL